MKNIIIISAAILVWGGCQTSPKFKQSAFETFAIQKITEKGIEEVEISSTNQAWPQIQYKETKPLPYKSKNLKIAILGDTGCRLKESDLGHEYQDCPNPKEWPYPQIANVIAADNYDFAIHTGDYHYRENCTDEKICAKITNSIGYGWGPWWEDFYQPSLPLFKKSPLLLIRGNHEDCGRAYSGWGPLSVLNKKFSDTCDEIEPFQWIEIDDLVLVNFDDSAFEDRKEMKDAQRLKWVEIFKRMNARLESVHGKKEIWFLAHRPVLGYVPNKNDAEPVAIRDNLKRVLTEAGSLKYFDYYLSGHIHNQQVITAEPNAVQVIVGNSGSSLDPFGRKIIGQSLKTTTATRNDFGYAIFERLGFKKWNWLFKNQSGQIELTCKVSAVKVNCD